MGRLFSLPVTSRRQLMYWPSLALVSFRSEPTILRFVRPSGWTSPDWSSTSLRFTLMNAIALLSRIRCRATISPFIRSSFAGIAGGSTSFEVVHLVEVLCQLLSGLTWHARQSLDLFGELVLPCESVADHDTLSWQAQEPGPELLD